MVQFSVLLEYYRVQFSVLLLRDPHFTKCNGDPREQQIHMHSARPQKGATGPIGTVVDHIQQERDGLPRCSWTCCSFFGLALCMWICCFSWIPVTPRFKVLKFSPATSFLSEVTKNDQTE